MDIVTRKLGGEEPIVLVQDRWLLPPTRVLIDIEEGGPHPGPVPNVKEALRTPGVSIESAIAQGQLPEF